MSTLHKEAAVSSGSDKKSIIILDYNKNKGGVDALDKLTATYTCQRMTRRWPMGAGTPRPSRCSLGQTAAELTKHSVHTHSNTKSISASILLIQPCLNTNHNSQNPSETT
ncbi:hypothetical protein MHYP_G00360630 [Metynnis hypsauchen]